MGSEDGWESGPDTGRTAGVLRQGGPRGGVVKDISDARGDAVIRQVWQSGSERAPHGKGL